MFTLKEIIDITKGNAFSVKANIAAKGISTDSRTINKGDLFIAINGKNFNGSNFINDARKKGAVGAIIPEESECLPDFPTIKVKDTRKSLGQIARAHRLKFKIPFIAITGSNGKTTTRDMIAHILGKRFKVLKTEGNENNDIGLPLTLFRLKNEDVAVIEIATNAPGEIKYLAEILRPNTAIITNIGPSHLEGLKDKHGVLKEKLSLIEALPPDGTWIKNLDDELLAAKDYDNIRVITYAIKENSADFKAKLLRQADNNMEFRLEVTPGVNKWQMGTDTFSTPLLGLHNIYNALAAIAASSLFVDAKSIKESLPTFKAPHMRMEVINTNGFTIINDAYNSNPLSFRYAASSLREYPARGKRILVCADMLELGKSSQMLHYECGRFLAENKTADFLIAFGSDSYSIVKGAIEHGMNEAMASFFKDKNEIVPYLRRIIKEGDVVLVKGSRAMKMEEIVDCFTTCSTR